MGRYRNGIVQNKAGDFVKSQQSLWKKAGVILAVLAVAGCASTKEAGKSAGNALQYLNPFAPERSEQQPVPAASTTQGAAAAPDQRESRKEERATKRAERKAKRQMQRAESAAAHRAWVEDRKAKRQQRITEDRTNRQIKRAALAAGANMDGIFMEGTPTAERYPFYQRPGDTGERSDKLQRRAWNEVIRRTEVRLVSDNRVRIDVQSPYVMSVEEMEYILLGRAAGEAYRAGFKDFSIVYARYQGGKGLGSLLLPQFNYATDDWIGSYEDLVRNREDQRLTGGYSRIGAKRIEAVIRFVGKDEKRRRQTFAADDLYLNMLNERLFGGEFPYR